MVQSGHIGGVAFGQVGDEESQLSAGVLHVALFVRGKGLSWTKSQ